MEREIDIKIDYLLRYISYDSYKKLIRNDNKYLLGLLVDNAYDINLNIRYLMRYGLSDIEGVILNNIEMLSKEHNLFIKEIEELEKRLQKKEIIALFENAS